MVEVFLNI